MLSPSLWKSWYKRVIYIEVVHPFVKYWLWRWSEEILSSPEQHYYLEGESDFSTAALKCPWKNLLINLNNTSRESRDYLWRYGSSTWCLQCCTSLTLLCQHSLYNFRLPFTRLVSIRQSLVYNVQAPGRLCGSEGACNCTHVSLPQEELYWYKKDMYGPKDRKWLHFWV